MKSLTHTYPTQDSSITIHGFMAYLLEMGEEWDIRREEEDIVRYHNLLYKRTNQTTALRQELFYWIELAENELLTSLPDYEALIEEGFHYLHWLVLEHVRPLNDIDKLNTKMFLHINEESYLYKVDDALCLFDKGEIVFDQVLLRGLPAQLLTYAACTTIEQLLSSKYIDDPHEWACTILEWIDDTPGIRLTNISFDIKDVYALYDVYLSDRKTTWDEDNKRFYTSGEPRKRNFMKHLLDQAKQDNNIAISCLENILTPKQLQSYSRKLKDWEQYVIDHTPHDKKPSSSNLSKFLTKFGKQTPRYQITRRLQAAATQEKNPTAQLAKEVKKMQAEKIIIADLHPLTEFIAIINQLFGTNIKYDSFAKRMK